VNTSWNSIRPSRPWQRREFGSVNSLDCYREANCVRERSYPCHKFVNCGRNAHRPCVLRVTIDQRSWSVDSPPTVRAESHLCFIALFLSSSKKHLRYTLCSAVLPRIIPAAVARLGPGSVKHSRVDRSGACWRTQIKCYSASVERLIIHMLMLG